MCVCGGGGARLFLFLTHTVVTDAAVRGSGGPEDLAGVTILELDNLVVDLDVTDPRWGALARRDVSLGCLWGRQRKPQT